LLARFATFEVAMALAGLGSLMLVAAGLARGRVRLPAAALALALGLASSAFGGFDAVGLGEGAAAAVLALVIFGRPPGLAAGWVGLMSTGFLAAVALQIWAPTIGFVIAWPLAAAAACAAVDGGETAGRPIARVFTLILIALTLAWLGGLLHNLMQGLDLPELPALIVWLAAFSLWPLVWPEPESSKGAAFAPGAAVVVAGLGLALWLHATNPYSPRHPLAVMPLYVHDHDSGKAWRVSPFKPDPWTSGVLAADGGAISQRRLPGFQQAVWAAPATPIAASEPQITTVNNGDGTVSLHAQAPADVTLDLMLKPTVALGQAALNGKPLALPSRPGAVIVIRWTAAPEGFGLSFKPAKPGALTIEYAAYRRQWPAQAKPLPSRPTDVMDWDMFGSTVATGTMTARW
jgi:hypothetical protein